MIEWLARVFGGSPWDASWLVALRQMLSDAPRLYDRAPDGDPEVADAVEAVSDDQDELESLGLTLLGDAAFIWPLLGRRLVLRVMTSPDRCVVAHVVGGTGVVQTRFVSASPDGDEVWTWRRLMHQDLAYGPHVDIAWRTTSFAETIAFHRSRIARFPERVVFRTLDDDLRAHAASQGRTLAWRRSQSPEALLELDARTFLGPGFGRFGARLMADLRAPVPRAVVLPKRTR